MKNSFLDNMIAAVAPVYAARRAAARQALDVINSGYGNYGASTTRKSMKGWHYYGGSAKEDIDDNVDVLRQRSRDAYMGVPIAAAALKTMRTNVIAGGLMPAPKVDSAFLKLSDEQTEKLQADIVREFAIWANGTDCDADGMDSFYQLQQLAFLSRIMNGDVIALMPFDTRAGQPYDLRIRLIEADRVCSPDGYDRLIPCEVNGKRVHRIVQGVETDRQGATVAYWIRSSHPLSSDAFNSQPVWTRVEARGKSSGRKNVLHLMHRERVGQVRGVPLLSPVLETIKQLGRYTDAEINAAVVSSLFTVFVTKEAASDERPFGEMIPELAEPYDDSSIELAPGALLDLNPGEDVKFADPKHPNNGYDKFSDAMVKLIGAALEIPAELLTKQFTTSFSAARAALNEFWRTCDMERDRFIEDFCQPIYEEWFCEAVARGRINAPGFFSDPAIKNAYLGCSWYGPSRTYLNPVQEVDAALKRVEAGFSTAQEEAAQMTGGDYVQNIKQRAVEAKLKSRVDKITKPPEKTSGGGEEI